MAEHGRNERGCHDCVHATGRGRRCDLSSWITSVDEYGNCEQWRGGDAPPPVLAGPDDGLRRRMDDNLRRAFG